MSIRKLCDCSRLVAIVGLALVLIAAVGATGWGQTPNCCQYPSIINVPDGQYRFPTIGHIEAQFGDVPVRLDLLGPTMVRTMGRVTKADGTIDIPTEMLALELTGMSPIGPVGLHLIPGTNSGGAINHNTFTFQNTSFFDVFTELSLDNAPWLGGQPDRVYVGQPNNQYIPVNVTNPSPLTCIPPQPGARWCTPPNFQPLPLISRTLNQQVGVLTLVWHTVLEPNHYKTWRVTDIAPPVSRTVAVKDQFMQDNLTLDSLVYLSNPTRKCILGGRCFDIADTTDHFTWYKARGRDTLLDVEFVNQFQQTTVRIDSVKYFLLPARKFPHNTPKLLDHYKAYKIRNPQPFSMPVQLEDQFDRIDPRGPENIISLIPRFFLTPAQKNNEPTYDMVTHFVAYGMNPKRPITMNRDVEDQFGIHSIRIDSSMYLLVPTCKLGARPVPVEEACCYTSPFGAQICALVPAGQCAAIGGTVVAACLGDGNGNGIDDACEQPQEEACCYTSPTGAHICALVPVGQCAAIGGTVVAACLGDGNGNGIDDACEPNHYKTWRVLQQDLLVFRTVSVRDQFMLDANVRLDSIHYLSNPTRKIVFNAAGPSDTFNVVDTTDHLTWYRATGRSLLRGLQVVFKNQFQTDTIRIDSVRYLLLPTQKFPHLPPDRLDHYKAYRIKKPRPFARPIELQDQFDRIDPRGPELINSLVPRYFLTPARKNNEPAYDTVTHYVAYEINPKRRVSLIRDTKDQFGVHVLQVDSSELLLVPTQKLFVSRKLKGDFNGTGDLTPADVALALFCVYLGSGDCDLSFSDLNCDGRVSPAEVVLELNAVFLGADFPC